MRAATDTKSRIRATWLIAIPLLLLVAGVTGLVVGYDNLQQNYAADLARPIEHAIVKQGAVRLCTRGDGGHGPDNYRPWYESYLLLPAAEDQAVAIANAAAAQAGYGLTHASPSNRGPLNVADLYIDKWYFSTKPSNNKQLKAGDIVLSVTVNANGDDKVCGGQKIDGRHSVVSVRTEAPDYVGH